MIYGNFSKGAFLCHVKKHPLSQLRIQTCEGGKPVGYLQSVVSLSLGSPRANPFGSLSQGYQPGLPYSNPQI